MGISLNCFLSGCSFVPHGPNYISKYISLSPYALPKRFILPCLAPAALHYTSPPPPSPPMSSETRRLLEAAMALSQLLSMHAIPHAFHGSVLTAVMSDSPRCDVRPSLSFAPSPSSSAGDLLHRRGWSHAPFPPRPSSGRKQRIFHHDTFTMEQSVEALPLDMSPPCNTRLHSLHATYRRFIPAVEVSSHLFEARAPCSSIFACIPDRNLACRRARSSATRHIHDHEVKGHSLFDPLRVCPRQTQGLVDASPHPLAARSLG